MQGGCYGWGRNRTYPLPIADAKGSPVIGSEELSPKPLFLWDDVDQAGLAISP
jgi:hypothetical protein